MVTSLLAVAKALFSSKAVTRTCLGPIGNSPTVWFFWVSPGVALILTILASVKPVPEM